MASLNDQIREYTALLGQGRIQQAYRGILSFMSGLRASLEGKYPDYATSALYLGYMDMTYFAFTPPALKDRKLKVAIVYLHEPGRFEAWLGGSNRAVQASHIQLLSQHGTAGYRLSQAGPGVDSILETVLAEQPDFDHPDVLGRLIEESTVGFINGVTELLRQPEGDSA